MVIYNDKSAPTNINNRASQWISKNFESRIVQDIIYDKLSPECQGNIIAAKMSRSKLLPNETLYNFVNEIESLLEKMNKKIDEMGYGEPAKFNSTVHSPEPVQGGKGKVRYKVKSLTPNGVVDKDVYYDDLTVNEEDDF